MNRVGKPVIAIVGHGRSGKDTAAEYLRDHTVLRFAGGSSWVAAPYMAEKLGLSLEEAWNSRHQRRMEWFDTLNELRAREGSTYLIRQCLMQSDIICGVRNRAELLDGRNEGLLDLIVWIERPGTPEDPTVEFSIDNADLVILNNSTLEAFHQKLHRFAKAMDLLKGVRRVA